MKTLKTYALKKSKTSNVFLTKVIATNKYFEQNYSPFIIVQPEVDRENIQKALAVLEANPFLETLGFYSEAAALMPAFLYGQLPASQRGHFYERATFATLPGEGCIRIEPIEMRPLEPFTLSQATLKRSEGEYELYYEGFLDSFERTHVQSDYFPLTLINQVVDKALVG